MKSIHLSDDNLHHRLKIRAIKEGKTLIVLVEELLSESMQK